MKANNSTEKFFRVRSACSSKQGAPPKNCDAASDLGSDKNREIFVSVVVVTRNRKDPFLELIHSLINQSYPKELYEIVVIDNDSNDNTIDLLEELSRNSPCKFIYSHQKRTGPASARNIGIKRSNGEVIAFTDDDCVADKDWLKAIAERFLDESSVTAVYGKIVSDEFPALYLTRVAPIDPSHSKYVTANIAYRRSVLEYVGYFDERFTIPFREDSDLAYRVIKSGFKIVYEPKAIVYHPIKEIGILGAIKSSWARRFDPLLYSKHPDLPKDVFGGALTGPLLGPLSIMGIIMVSLVITFSFVLILRIYTVFILSSILIYLSYLLFFLVYGYRLLCFPWQRHKINIHSKIGAALILIPYLLVLMVARIYGSIKFRKLLI